MQKNNSLWHHPVLRIFTNTNFIFFVVLFIAAFLRLYHLGSVPAFFNRDEASLGYNAYSLLQTGREEHAQSWPINIESFGDWKLPGYVYSLFPFLAIFGLETWAVRLPAALAGIACVVLSFFLSQQLFPKKKKYFHLLVMTLMAINPWAIHLSRQAYEANLASFFFLFGFFFANFSREKKQATQLLPLTALLWIAAMFTYHAYQIFVPLFGLFWLIKNRHIFTIKSRENIIILVLSAIIVGLGLVLLLFGNAQHADQTKFAGLSILSVDSYRPEQVLEQQMFSRENSLFARFYSSPYPAILKKTIRHFYQSFAGDFMSITGGANAVHNTSNLANFYFFEYLFFLVGLYALFRHWEKNSSWIFAWLILAALPAVITIEATHNTRLSAEIFPWILLIAFGIEQILSLLKKKWRILAVLALTGLYVYSLFYLVVSTFVINDKKQLDNFDWYMEPIVKKVLPIQQNFDQVILPFYQNTPYIYFLFYGEYDPQLAQETLSYYPLDDEGFRYAQQLGNINFADHLDWLENETRYQHILYVIDQQDVPDFIRTDQRYQIIDTISNRWSEKTFWLIEFQEK
jgi:4-amino-4-deoxy-L-arabinose transferase-like glycosyltransferase